MNINVYSLSNNIGSMKYPTTSTQKVYPSALIMLWEGAFMSLEIIQLCHA